MVVNPDKLHAWTGHETPEERSRAPDRPARVGLPRLETRLDARQVAAEVPQPSRDPGVGEVVPDRFEPRLATQAEDRRPPQLPSAHPGVEDGPHHGPRTGLLALNEEAGGQAAQPFTGTAHVHRRSGRGQESSAPPG